MAHEQKMVFVNGGAHNLMDPLEALPANPLR